MLMATVDRLEAGIPQPESFKEDAVLETRFGPVPLKPEQQIRFQGGLPGFPEVESFQLEPVPGGAGDLCLLQALDAPEVGFFVMPLPQSTKVLASEDVGSTCRSLGIAAGDLLLLVVVTLQRTSGGIAKFVNLRAPLFVDVRRRAGAQVVLASPSYPLRFELKAEA